MFNSWSQFLLRKRFHSLSHIFQRLNSLRHIEKKKFYSLSHIFWKNQFILSFIFKEGSILWVKLEKSSILWVVLKKKFNSLSHAEKKFGSWRSKLLKEGSSLWVMWKKSNSLSHMKRFKSVEFSEWIILHKKKFNS